MLSPLRRNCLTNGCNHELQRSSVRFAKEPDPSPRGGFRRHQVSEQHSRLVNRFQRPDNVFLKPFRLRQEATMLPNNVRKAFRQALQEEGARVVDVAEATKKRDFRQRWMKVNEIGEETRIPVYDRTEASIYAASDGPLSFASTSRAVFELKKLRPEFQPMTMLDYGCGAGSATLATAAIYSPGRWKMRPGTSGLEEDTAHFNWFAGVPLQHATMVERSDGMAAIGMVLVEKALQYTTPTGIVKQSLATTWLRTVRDIPTRAEYDLVIANRSFEEIGGGTKPLFAAAAALFSVARRYLIIIERGDIEGFNRIERIRSFFQKGADPEYRVRGADIIAPCLHSYDCPMANKKLSCTFFQRYHIPEFQRLTVRLNFPDGKAFFSYLILERVNTEDPMLPPDTYARVVRTPLKRGKHVHVDVCSRQGNLERITVTPKAGRPIYKLARKTRLGDFWPVPPRSIPEKEDVLYRQAENRLKAQCRAKEKRRKARVAAKEAGPPAVIEDVEAPTAVEDAEAPTAVDNAGAPAGAEDAGALAAGEDADAPAVVTDAEATAGPREGQAENRLKAQRKAKEQRRLAGVAAKEAGTPAAIEDAEAPTAVEDAGAPAAAEDAGDLAAGKDTDAPAVVTDAEAQAGPREGSP